MLAGPFLQANTMKTIRLLTNIMLSGKRVAAGSIVEAPRTVANDLIHRRRAELVEAATPPPPVAVDDAETSADVPTAEDAPDASEPRRRRRK